MTSDAPPIADAEFAERLEVFCGEASDALAHVYARLRGADIERGWQLAGSVTGPTSRICRHIAGSLRPGRSWPGSLAAGGGGDAGAVFLDAGDAALVSRGNRAARRATRARARAHARSACGGWARQDAICCSTASGGCCGPSRTTNNRSAIWPPGTRPTWQCSCASRPRSFVVRRAAWACWSLSIGARNA